MEINRPTLTVLLLLSTSAVGYGLYEHQQRRTQELRSGLEASQVLTETLRKKALLQVGELSGEVKSRGECASAYVFNNEQNTIAPFTVGYSVNLRDMDRNAYRWNEEKRVMYVTAPEVVVAPPNVDMSQARSAQTGIYVSRACGIALQRQVAGRLRDKVSERASSSENLVKARDFARDALAGLLRGPLQASGVPDVKVVIRFPSDPRPVGSDTWDLSRPIADVLRNGA